MDSVGFSGPGNMGHPMASRLRDAQVDLCVQDAVQAAVAAEARA